MVHMKLKFSPVYWLNPRSSVFPKTKQNSIDLMNNLLSFKQGKYSLLPYGDRSVPSFYKQDLLP